MSFNVLISDPLSEEGVHPLKEADNLNITKKTDLTKDELLKEIGNYDALLVRSQTQVTREGIEQAHNLKVIARAGVGEENIDLDAATESGVIVVNEPDGNNNQEEEHRIAVLIQLESRRP